MYDPYSAPDEVEDSHPKPKETSASWMITVADLFSLMLTFFVLLYSMSVIQHDRWEVIAKSLMQRLKPIQEETTDFTTPDVHSVEREDIRWARGLDYLNRVIIGKLQENGVAFEDIRLYRLPDRLILSLASDKMFPPGSTRLMPDARIAIRQLSAFLSRIGNAITIEGHTDPTPISNASFPSNWELSMARASAVASILRSEGYPYQLNILGLGSSRYETWQKEFGTKQNHALARRVDIVIRETVAKY